MRPPAGNASGLLPACLMAAAGAIVFLALPLLVGLIMEALELAEDEVGLVASTYFAAYLLSSASAYLWVNRVPLRRASFLAYGLMGTGLTLGATADTINLMLPALAIGGVGGGMLFSLGVAIIAAGGDTDRNYGWLLAAQQLLAAIFLFTVPRWVVPDWGLSGTFATLAFICLLLALSIPLIPIRLARQSAPVTEESSAHWARHRPRIALVTLVLHFSGLSALWAFVERIGVNQGLTNEQTGLALSASMLAGLAGAFLVTLVADRFGRRLPLWLATALFVLVCAGFAGEQTWITFTILSGLLSFAWNFILAYQMGIVSDLDKSGTHAVLIPAAQGLGAMLGPVVGGSIITLGSYTGLLLSVALVCLITTSAFSHLAGSRH